MDASGSDASASSSSSSSVRPRTQQGSAGCADSVHEVMEQEWEKMRTEDTTLPQITPQRKRGGSRIRPECCKRRPPDHPVFSSDDEYEVLWIRSVQINAN